MLSQLAFGTSPDGIVIMANLGQWYLIAFFFRKMISLETQYKTHNDKLLAIVNIFKTWRYYLENCKHEAFVLTDHNNLCCFINMMSLSSKHVRWAKSSLNTISKSIIAKARQMQLQMLYQDFCKRFRIKKMSSKLRMAKSFIVCRIY